MHDHGQEKNGENRWNICMGGRKGNKAKEFGFYRAVIPEWECKALRKQDVLLGNPSKDVGEQDLADLSQHIVQKGI